MKTILMIIVLSIGLIGWLWPRNKAPLSSPIIIVMVILFLSVVALQLFIERTEVREQAKLKYSGTLETKSKVLLSPEKKSLPKFEFGNSGAILVWDGPQGKPIFKIFEDNSFTILVEDGQIKVSTLIRNKDGSIIAELTNNEWKINPSNSFDRNYTKDVLEVKDAHGDIILQVRLVGDKVQFQGKFYSKDGRGVAFGKSVGPAGTGGAIEITGPSHPELLLSIEPIFKYPSDLHLGELR